MARDMENLVLVVILIAVAMVEAQAQVHHVVGGDRGWAIASDLHSWSSHRNFSVGDTIWFTFSAAEESILELRSKEEFESCDIKNPIKMYTDGINKVGLQGEGARYFVSSKHENCKNGLKLHVQVVPAAPNVLHRAQPLAAAGPTPSASVALSATAAAAAAAAAAALVFL